MDIIFIQTSDPFRYRPMLAITAENVASQCGRHGFDFVEELFVPYDGLTRLGRAARSEEGGFALSQNQTDKAHRGLFRRSELDLRDLMAKGDDVERQPLDIGAREQ